MTRGLVSDPVVESLGRIVPFHNGRGCDQCVCLRSDYLILPPQSSQSAKGAFSSRCDKMFVALCDKIFKHRYRAVEHQARLAIDTSLILGSTTSFPKSQWGRSSSKTSYYRRKSQHSVRRFNTFQGEFLIEAGCLMSPVPCVTRHLSSTALFIWNLWEA